jgi:hypothetical protein
MPLGLKLSGTNWNIPGAPKFSADPMLENALGVDALFYTRSANSWTKPGQPDPLNQKWFNLAPSAAVPYLLVGSTDASESIDPTFFNGGFRTTAAQFDALSAPTLTDFNYSTTSFLHTFWWKPSPDWASGGNVQILSGKFNLGDSQFVLYAEGNGTILTAQFVTGPTNNSQPNGLSYPVTFGVGTTYQVGLSWQKTGANTSIRKLYLQGVKVAEGALASGSLTNSTGARYRIGNDTLNGYPSNIIAYCSYFENLDISGNSPEDRVALEWAKRKNKF